MLIRCWVRKLSDDSYPSNALPQTTYYCYCQDREQQSRDSDKRHALVWYIVRMALDGNLSDRTLGVHILFIQPLFP
jgi:hypothetical protein